MSDEMNRDLFLAILAMDSYNRGYDRGVKVTPNESDRAFIGNASSLNLELPTGSQAAGFYAIAYDMTGVAGFGAGERVMS